MPIFFCFAYDGINAVAYIKVLCFKWKLYPAKSKKEKIYKTQTDDSEKIPQTKKKKFVLPVDIHAIFHNLSTIKDILTGTFKCLAECFTIVDFRLAISVNSSDVYDTAKQYAIVCSSVYNTWMLVENTLNVKKRYIRIDPVFVGNSDILVNGILSFRLAKIIIALLKLTWIYKKNATLIKIIFKKTT